MPMQFATHRASNKWRRDLNVTRRIETCRSVETAGLRLRTLSAPSADLLKRMMLCSRPQAGAHRKMPIGCRADLQKLNVCERRSNGSWRPPLSQSAQVQAIAMR